MNKELNDALDALIENLKDDQKKQIIIGAKSKLNAIDFKSPVDDIHAVAAIRAIVSVVVSEHAAAISFDGDGESARPAQMGHGAVMGVGSE